MLAAAPYILLQFLPKTCAAGCAGVAIRWSAEEVRSKVSCQAWPRTSRSRVLPGYRNYSAVTSRATSDMPCDQVLQPEFMP